MYFDQKQIFHFHKKTKRRMINSSSIVTKTIKTLIKSRKNLSYLEMTGLCLSKDGLKYKNNIQGGRKSPECIICLASCFANTSTMLTNEKSNEKSNRNIKNLKKLSTRFP